MPRKKSSLINKVKAQMKLLLILTLLTSSFSFATSTETIELKAKLELELTKASDHTNYNEPNLVASAWRLAKIQLDETVSRSGNKLLFDKEQALKLANFAYDMAKSSQNIINKPELGSTIAVLAQWHLIFGDNTKSVYEVKRLCLEFQALGLNRDHHAYETINNMLEWVLLQG